MTSATPDGPRIRPLPPPSGRGRCATRWPPCGRPSRAIPLPRQGGDRPKGLNVLGTLARHPTLARAFHTFNGHVLFGTTLSVRQRELLVLRVATVRGSEYEWAQHVVLAGDAGIDAAEIARIAEGPDAAGWDPVEGAMVRAVDELLADARIADPTWEVLAGALDERQLMDVVFTVGAYDLLAMAFRSFGVELDDDLKHRAR
jgi:alkylhydroperoxidase family enzyme